MPAFGSWKAAEKITATLPTGTLTTDGCAVAVCDFGWVPGPCANAAEVASKRMNANAIIKSFRFMMCTSNASAESEGPRANVLVLCSLPFALRLFFRRQGRSGRVLTIELSDEWPGNIQRFGGANDALNFGDIEY